MTKKISISIGVAAIVLGGILWRLNSAPGGGSKDPFADLKIPAKYLEDETTKQRTEAEIDKTKALYKEAPNEWDTWIAIGNLYSLLEDYDGAIGAYQKSLEIMPNNVLGYRNIAAVYKYNLRDFDKAESYYRLAINNKPGDVDLYIELAQVLDRQLKLPDKAEAVYLEGLNATNNYPDIMVALVEFYKSTGQTKKYSDTVKKLLSLYPDNELYRKTYGN